MRASHSRLSFRSSRTTLLHFILLLCSAHLTGASEPTGLLRTMESLEVTVIQVEVFVTDKDGNPVHGLKKKDFKLLEDGKKQKVLTFQEIQSTPSTSLSNSPGSSSKKSQTPSDSDREVPESSGTLQNVVLFIDNMAIDPQRRRLVRKELQTFLDNELSEDFQLAVASYDGSLRLHQGFTRDRNALRDAVEEASQLSPLGIAWQKEQNQLMYDGLENLAKIQSLATSETQGPEASRYFSQYALEVDAYAARVQQQNQLRFFSMSHLINAMAVLPGRKVFLYVSDGLPLNPGAELYHAMTQQAQNLSRDMQTLGPLDGEQRDAFISARSSSLEALSDSSPGGRRSRSREKPSKNGSLQQLLALANSSQVSFYTLRPQNLAGGMTADMSNTVAANYTPELRSVRNANLSQGLQLMAKETGGRAFSGARIQDLLEQARADGSGYYALTYQSQNPEKKGFRKIEVKVKKRGTEVRHRTGYINKSLEAHISDRTTAALLLGVEDNPLDLALSIGTASASNRRNVWDVPVRIGIPLRLLGLQPEKQSLVLNAQILIASRDERGLLAPVQMYDARIEVPREQMERTPEAIFPADLVLALQEGPQRIAVGFVDPVTGAISFASQDVQVGAAPTSSPGK